MVLVSVVVCETVINLLPFCLQFVKLGTLNSVFCKNGWKLLIKYDNFYRIVCMMTLKDEHGHKTTKTTYHSFILICCTRLNDFCVRIYPWFECYDAFEQKLMDVVFVCLHCRFWRRNCVNSFLSKPLLITVTWQELTSPPDGRRFVFSLTRKLFARVRRKSNFPEAWMLFLQGWKCCFTILSASPRLWCNVGFVSCISARNSNAFFGHSTSADWDKTHGVETHRAISTSGRHYFWIVETTFVIELLMCTIRAVTMLPIHWN